MSEKRDRIEVKGARVALRPAIEDDIAAMAPWYAGAAAAGRGRPERLEELDRRLRGVESDPDRGLLAITRVGDLAPIGLLEYRLGRPRGDWCVVTFLVVAQDSRGWGYGSEALRLLEEEASCRWGVRRFGADVAVDNGLALYFWLRLGYRPARPGGSFWRSGLDRDIISMIRVLD